MVGFLLVGTHLEGTVGMPFEQHCVHVLYRTIKAISQYIMSVQASACISGTCLAHEPT